MGWTMERNAFGVSSVTPVRGANGMIMAVTRSRTPPGAGAVERSVALKSC
nr:hypothetical protein [uncultured Oscillibacter sp.]